MSGQPEACGSRHCEVLPEKAGAREPVELAERWLEVGSGRAVRGKPWAAAGRVPAPCFKSKLWRSFQQQSHSCATLLFSLQLLWLLKQVLCFRVVPETVLVTQRCLCWNRLPREAVASPSLEIFRSTILGIVRKASPLGRKERNWKNNPKTREKDKKAQVRYCPIVWPEKPLKGTLLLWPQHRSDENSRFKFTGKQ